MTTEASSAPEQTTQLMNRGQPLATVSLGDTLANQFQFAIDADTSTGWTVEYGMGLNTSGAGWTWSAGTSVSNDGVNYYWTSDAGELSFNATGTWYYAGRFITTGDPSYTYFADVETTTDNLVLEAESYFTVVALEVPTSVSAVTNAAAAATRADLSWAQWNSKNVLITRGLAAPTEAPVDATAYAVNESLGNHVVIAQNQGGTSLTATNLLPGETYFFTVYTENNTYYSPGVTVSVTMGRPKARNTDGSASPQAPSTIYLGDSGLTFGLDAWGQVETNGGAARLWLKYNDSDISSGTASDWTSYTTSENRTRTSGTFDETGTWYWGMQMDYGAPYGTDFWYKASSTTFEELATDGDGSTLTVTVSAINDPSGQSAVADNVSLTPEIDLTWSKNAQSHNVMIVRKAAAASWTEPTQGTAYSVSASLGSGTVIYNGSAESVSDTSGLAYNATYDYKFYSVNNDYYSAGVTSAPVTTAVCEPSAPTGLAVSGRTDDGFTVSWTASAKATEYRLDISGDSDFQAPPDLATDLFISEYIEGSSNEKYIEIFNGTGADVDLSGYALLLYANGGTSTTASNTLSGTLTNLGTVVYRNTSATNTIATISSSVNFNGDDALALWKRSSASYVDIFGRIGEDPGTAWSSGSHSTLDKTLVRKSSVRGGILVNPASGFPTLESEWDVYAIGNQDDLGKHTFSGGSGSPLYVAGYSNLVVSGTSQAVTGLDPDTAYYIRVRAENSNGPCVSENSATFDTITIAAEPTIHAENVVFSSVVGTRMNISWTSGNGSNRIVVMREAADVTWSPTDGVAIAAADVNTNFTTAVDQGDGNKIVYNGSGTTVGVSGLSTVTVYYVRVYEYNGASDTPVEPASVDGAKTRSSISTLALDEGESTANFFTSGDPGGGNQVTAVVLYYFRAVDENGTVVLRWATASEQDTVGFFVERWNGSDWVRLNQNIIPAAGENGGGASYSYVDTTAVPGVEYRYRLIEIEGDGDQLEYGPFDRTPSALAFESPVVPVDGGMRIRWLSRADEAYVVWRSGDLSADGGGFEAIVEGVEATPPENEFLDTDPLPFGVYRITIAE